MGEFDVGGLLVATAAAMKGMDERIAQIEQGRDASRAAAIDDGYDGEGLDSLESFMAAHNIADHAVAIPAFEREHPPAEPIASSGSRRALLAQPRREIDPAAELRALFDGDEAGFVDRGIRAALAEVRNIR